MSVIKPTCLRDIKLRVNIVDVVSRVITLRKAGARFKGLCPFHSEKTPSFNVDADKGFFKCFGCGKAGDVITFVRDTEQLTFTEAIEALGKRFGVVIEYEEGTGPTKEERTLRQELFDLHEFAADHYFQKFKGKDHEGEFIRSYWTDKRRFLPELADEFKIGLSETDEGGLGSAVLKRRFSEEAIRQCGLFFVRSPTVMTMVSLRPRFRGRLMIPIRDHQGRVVAFTGRQTELTPKDDPAFEAKYVNSPETPIFTKGNLLFNLDRARDPASKENRPFVLVEGQLDALRCWSVGLKTAVAPQGTAITESQLLLLRRYQHRVECFFDSDDAGQKASLRFLPLALKTGLEVRFLGAQATSKIDPDILLLERGLAAYAELEKTSLSAMAYACASILPQPDRASSEEKTRAAAQVQSIIAAADSEVARSQFLAEAAACLKLPVAALQKDFQASLARQQRSFRREDTTAAPSAAPSSPDSACNRDIAPEQHLLLVCLHWEQMGKSLAHAFPHDWIDLSHPCGALLNRFLAEFEHDNWPGREHLDILLETPEEKALIASMLFDAPALDDPVKALQEGIHRLRARSLEPRLRKIDLDLATHHAESSVDAISLLKLRSELLRQLRQPITLVPL
ncbi:MAG: DNA primase [Opitutaceae bacterium]|nr:DNA primase [Opitutaceae bacterium]